MTEKHSDDLIESVSRAPRDVGWRRCQTWSTRGSVASAW
jgi:hypothetical protein